MLVLNLACEAGHGFEGWFGSATDFESQQQRGLLSCPLCSSAQVRRMPSAPRLNLSSAPEPAAAAGRSSSGNGGDASGPRSPSGHPMSQYPGPHDGRPSGRHRDLPAVRSDGRAGDGPIVPATGPHTGLTPADLQRQVMQAVRQIMANTEDVGERFAEEARRIHYGETEARGIRGQATPDEAQALVEEGIDVVALAVPEALKDPLQ
ncbi:DUF1178 family protein [Roseateles terrae]|uniref:DUF1178 domain-containing protein n=1 Tax=Roseateles terrae TaxID=431060 RepID=A0ABR6GNC6_9BURK|nr:DUF1178 family protein [Roseateles terrae]MBB3193555.1 hypothetical protein [Roseateles terrae]OWQ89277.1 hypothetical protein CDN98_01630 [Roseateles terrae]